ncbi:MAG: signal peptide peptidase SppA [Candidatus Binatia bacterium]|nr:signal peptide peptidase SppA [Candidatus Binatia bacterium]
MAKPRHPAGRAFRFFLAFAGVFAFVAFVVTLLPGSPGGSLLRTGDLHVALVPLRGEISRSDAFVETLSDLQKDSSVGAVVVRIESPGGAVAPSQEMYDAVLRLREEKPVIASLGSVAASGGYYVACAADVVVANPGTLTGSIGVIMQLTNLEGLMDKVGVRAEIVTAGTQKDMGSPFRSLSAPERAIFQTMADEVHTQFIDAVAVGRGMTPEAMRRVSTGRTFTGEQAQGLGLVDELGGLHEAVAIAAARAGIEGEPVVEKVSPRRGPWWMRALFSDESGVSAGGSALSHFADSLATLAGTSGDERTPQFLWRLPVVTEGLR